MTVLNETEVREITLKILSKAIPLGSKRSHQTIRESCLETVATLLSINKTVLVSFFETVRANTDQSEENFVETYTTSCNYFTKILLETLLEHLEQRDSKEARVQRACFDATVILKRQGVDASELLGM
jgi:hypothetical protein